MRNLHPSTKWRVSASMSVIREFLNHPLRLLLWFSWLQKSNFLYPCTVFFWPRRWAKSEENTPRKQQFHWLGWPTTFKNHLFLEKNSCLSNINPIYSICTSLFYKIEGGIFFHTLDPGRTLYGKAPPWGPTPYCFIYHFCHKRYPFRIPSIFIDT